MWWKRGNITKCEISYIKQIIPAKTFPRAKTLNEQKSSKRRVWGIIRWHIWPNHIKFGIRSGCKLTEREVFGPTMRKVSKIIWRQKYYWLRHDQWRQYYRGERWRLRIGSWSRTPPNVWCCEYSWELLNHHKTPKECLLDIAPYDD